MRLPAILAGYVPWEGWEVHNGYLFPPGYRRGGIRPGEFFAVVFYRQQVAEYQRVNRQLVARVKALELTASGAPVAQLPEEFAAAIADLGARVQAVSADLLALGARTCNTGTLCHGWHCRRPVALRAGRTPGRFGQVRIFGGKETFGRNVDG